MNTNKDEEEEEEEEEERVRKWMHKYPWREKETEIPEITRWGMREKMERGGQVQCLFRGNNRERKQARRWRTTVQITRSESALAPGLIPLLTRMQKHIQRLDSSLSLLSLCLLSCSSWTCSNWFHCRCASWAVCHFINVRHMCDLPALGWKGSGARNESHVIALNGSCWGERRPTNGGEFTTCI